MNGLYDYLNDTETEELLNEWMNECQSMIESHLVLFLKLTKNTTVLNAEHVFPLTFLSFTYDIFLMYHS